MTAPSFRVGAKELFLPSFSIAFLRTPGLGPHFARFRVPLWFSKLDLRDYLWHGYGVEIVSTRSYVKQSRVQQGKENQVRPTPQRWHRPRARKFMTVELVRPFVWPAEPSDYAEWNQAERRDGADYAEKYSEAHLGSRKDAVVNVDRRAAMREQAEALLQGKARWRPSGYRGATVGTGRRS